MAEIGSRVAVALLSNRYLMMPEVDRVVERAVYLLVPPFSFRGSHRVP